MAPRGGGGGHQGVERRLRNLAAASSVLLIAGVTTAVQSSAQAAPRLTAAPILMGAFAAPLLVDSSGRVDALYEEHPTDSTSPYALHPGYEYFTWSNDAGATWPNPTVQVRPEAGTIALANWWINGSIAIDAGGTLYATWDTQPTSSTDTGWLS